MQTTDLTEQTSRWALGGQAALKAYLMLAQPEKAEAAFLAPQLVQHWSTEARITPGEKQDMAERLFKFYAEHLKAKPDWSIEPRSELVAGARQTLLAVIGERNAQDSIYQSIVNGAGNKYPDQTLASLTTGTDPRGLLRVSAVVPGVLRGRPMRSMWRRRSRTPPSASRWPATGSLQEEGLRSQLRRRVPARI